MTALAVLRCSLLHSFKIVRQVNFQYTYHFIPKRKFIFVTISVFPKSIMNTKKPSGAAYRKLRKEKEEAATKNTPKLTTLFRNEGLFISHIDLRNQQIFSLDFLLLKAPQVKMH